MWLAADDKEEENVFVWSAGPEQGWRLFHKVPSVEAGGPKDRPNNMYTNWAKFEPDNGRHFKHEDCVSLSLGDGWYDVDCERRGEGVVVEFGAESPVDAPTPPAPAGHDEL